MRNLPSGKTSLIFTSKYTIKILSTYISACVRVYIIYFHLCQGNRTVLLASLGTKAIGVGQYSYHYSRSTFCNSERLLWSIRTFPKVQPAASIQQPRSVVVPQLRPETQNYRKYLLRKSGICIYVGCSIRIDKHHFTTKLPEDRRNAISIRMVWALVVLQKLVLSILEKI